MRAHLKHMADTTMSETTPEVSIARELCSSSSETDLADQMSVDEVVLEKDEDASDADSVLDPLPFVARAAEAKERGNEFFKKGENEAAVTAYDAGTAVVAEWNALKAKAKEADAEIQDSDDEEDAAAAATDAALSVEVNDLAVSLHLNKGLALIKSRPPAPQ